MHTSRSLSNVSISVNLTFFLLLKSLLCLLILPFVYHMLEIMSFLFITGLKFFNFEGT